MSLPTVELAAALGAADPSLSTYPAAVELVDPPAVVLRPDQPWVSRESAMVDLERYVAIGVVSASDPSSAADELHRIVHLIARTCDDVPGWAFEQAGRIIVDESTGVPFLAAAVRLTYRSCDEV